MSGQYDIILEELAPLIKAPKLESDNNNTCLVNISGIADVQIEPDPAGNLLLFAEVAKILPGAYRANLFKEALKFNALPPPVLGIFAFSEVTDQLIFHIRLPMRNLTGQKVADRLFPLIAVVKKWREMIESGSVPAIDTETPIAKTGGGMFGL